MRKKRNKNSSIRGDISILFVFIILIIVLMGSLIMSVTSIGTLKSGKEAENSVQALYTADTGLERGMFDYNWGENGLEKCTNTASDIILPGGSSYKLTVNRGEDDLCPTYNEVANKEKAFCINAYAKNKGTNRRLRSAKEGYDGSTVLTCPD